MLICRWKSIATLAIVVGACLFSRPATADDPYRVRGVLFEVALPSLIVDSRDGERVATKLNDDSGVYVVTQGAREDIQANQFVGITSVGGQGGSRVALEVHIFAEDLRGLGEGHYPWDLTVEPNMMTNASVIEIEAVADGPTLTVGYSEVEQSGNIKKGQQQIMIPKDSPVVHFAKGDRAMLTAGKEVFLLLKDDDAGLPVLLGIVVGDGIAPPM